MSGQVLLDVATSEAIQGEAKAFLGKVRDLIGDNAPAAAVDAAAFLVSVAVQSTIRANIGAVPEQNEAVLIGAAEGLGMILGLIEEPMSRMVMFQRCVGAANVAVQQQSQIHTPAGEA